MKTISVYDQTTGQVLRTVTCQEEDVLLNVKSGELWLDAEVSDETHYVQNGELVQLPSRPSPHHDWDWATKSWLPNLDAAREAKLQQVVAELTTRLYLPCNGFDADKVSRGRISGVIARLQRGDGLPAGWVGWRDANNQQQWVTDSAETVLANLTTLSCAIEDREQALLIASWSHKANIAALVNIEAVMNYNVNEGWEA